MKQKEKLSIKNIEKYEEALRSMIVKYSLKKSELIDFVASYRPEEDESAFYVTSAVPIPSCIVNNIYLNNSTNTPLFEYKIQTHGTMSHDFKTFKNFIENGGLAEFSFYGAVFDLVIFQDKKEKKFDTFNITFDSIYSLFDILKQQREADLAYRSFWLQENYDLIKENINKYNNNILTCEALDEEIRAKSKINKGHKFYFETIGRQCLLEEAKEEQYSLKKNIKDQSKNILYPRAINFATMQKAIASGSKIKVVSYIRDSDGELNFYFFK